MHSRTGRGPASPGWARGHSCVINAQRSSSRALSSLVARCQYRRQTVTLSLATQRTSCSPDDNSIRTTSPLASVK